MNERIRELAEQTQGPRPRIHGEWTLTNAELEMFVKLIVQECCNVLQGEDIRYGGYGYNQGFLHKKIKQHFGVEE